MSLTDGTVGLSAADIAAITKGNSNNDFLGGNGAWWLIIILLFFCNGNNNNGINSLLPFIMGNSSPAPAIAATTQNDVQRGFDQAALIDGITGISSALSTGFSNAEISRCNSQANILQALNTNQTATTNGMNALAMALQNSTFSNTSGIADLKYTVATENCADRTAMNNAIRDVLVAGNDNVQTITNAMTTGFNNLMTKICQLELDGKNDRIAELQSMLNEANRKASQNDQTAQILASQASQTAMLEQYLRPTPNPAYIVPNPNCCSQNFGCAA